MSDDLDRLQAALRTQTPPDMDAKQRAISAGLAEFKKNIQGSGAGARPTSEQPRWWWLSISGVQDMFRKLNTRNLLMTGASLATIALAVVITGPYRQNPVDDIAPVAPAGNVVRGIDKLVPLDTTLPDDGVLHSLVSTPSAPVATERMAASPMTEAIVAAPMPYAAMTQSSPEFYLPPPNTEAFANADVNPLKITSETPVSTFSIDVDTASYAIMRSDLMGGRLPEAEAVRTEEMLNYFSYDYPVPDKAEVPFSTSVSVLDSPWNNGTKLLHIGIKGYDLPIDERPPLNLVFLIDTSGSMQDSDKLPLLINSFRLMLSKLQPDDKVAIVTYAGSSGVVLEPTPASEKAPIVASLENLYAGGSTAGQAGLQQAYALAQQMGTKDATARVILATDGDFNVGISDPEALKSYIADKRDTGVYLSVLGFGRGNLNDALMQALAQNGNGTAAYIDTLAEAQKVLVDQIGGALFPIANDVKIQVEFNPAEIAEYRLIGYETRALNREDFNNDKVDAGDIGAGHTVTAIYEITPVGSPAVRVDDLRYGTDEPGSVNTGEYAFVKLRYKLPGEDISHLISTPVTPDSDAGIGQEARFAAAVAAFGQILRGDTMMNGYTIAQARALAEANKGQDVYGYRAGLITLMRLAEALK